MARRRGLACCRRAHPMSRPRSTMDRWTAPCPSVHRAGRGPGQPRCAAWPAEPVAPIDLGNFAEKPLCFDEINPQSTSVQKYLDLGLDFSSLTPVAVGI